MSKIISFAFAIVAIAAAGCASTKLTQEEWENMSPAERELYAMEQLERRRRMQVLGLSIQQAGQEFNRSLQESMRQNQLDRIERNQQQILNNQNRNNFYQQPTKRGIRF